MGIAFQLSGGESPSPVPFCPLVEQEFRMGIMPPLEKAPEETENLFFFTATVSAGTRPSDPGMPSAMSTSCQLNTSSSMLNIFSSNFIAKYFIAAKGSPLTTSA